MRICATMIVKNEAHVLRRCLESVLPLVDCICVCDTGSTDETETVFYKTLLDWQGPATAGLFVRREWMNFGNNRTEAFRIAEHHFSLTAEDWHLVIDADDVLDRRITVQDARFTLGCWVDPESGETVVLAKDGPRINEDRERILCKPADCWTLQVEHSGTTYTRPHLFRADGLWEYRWPLHEAACRIDGKPHTQGHLPGLSVVFGGDGHRSQLGQREKYLADADICRAYLAEHPEDTRMAFYLAQSLKDAGQDREAIQAYLKRVSMGGWAQEAYYSLLQAGRLARHRNLACEGTLQRAHLLDPTRAEAPYELALVVLWHHDRDPHGENARDYLVSAYQWAEVAATRPEPSKDHLFVEPDVWMWSRNLAAQLRGKLCSYG